MGVVVQNISSQQAVITDEDGYFSIPVRKNDTLVFAAVHFKQKQLPIHETLYNTPFLNVSLEEFVNELDEVVVRPYNLSGNLNRDVENLPRHEPLSAETLELPNAHVTIISQSERKLQEASGMRVIAGGGLGGAGGAVSLNPILNAFTGRTKMLKNRVKIDKTYARTQRIQHFYTDSVLTSTLKIPKEKIADFMYFCEVDATFQTVVKTRDKLKLWDFMITKSRAYRKNNHLH